MNPYSNKKKTKQKKEKKERKREREGGRKKERSYPEVCRGNSGYWVIKAVAERADAFIFVPLEERQR